MRKLMLCLLPLLWLSGATGCMYFAGVAGFGSGFIQAEPVFPRPTLYYRSFNGGAPPVYPNTCVSYVPDQDGTWFTLNNGCEDAAVKVMEGSINIGYDRNSDSFWIPNTRKGGWPRNIVVTVDCAGYDQPWVLHFTVKSSGPRIHRW